MESKKFLVTGGAGFLGTHLVEKLLENGNQVICMDNEFRGSFENLKNHSQDLTLVRGDITNAEDWPKNTGKINGVFHFGAINGTKYFYSIPEQVLEVNVQGTINALEFVRTHDIEYLSFASSPEVYGIPDVFPTPESAPLIVPDLENPRWSYGGSKIIGEIFCANYAKKYGFSCSILRYNNAYGPRDESGHVIPDLIQKLLKNEEFAVEGTGQETRSFCYVKDCIDATLLIKEKQSTPIDIFNVGNDVETKIIDLIKLLKKVSDKKINPIFKKKEFAGTSRRLPDITKLRKLGYSPKVSLEDGLKLTYQWHLANS